MEEEECKAQETKEAEERAEEARQAKIRAFLLVGAALGVMVLVFWAYRNRNNKDNETNKADNDNSVNHPKEDMAERAADLAERRGEAGEAMEDFGRAGCRDGPAQAEDPPQNDDEYHDAEEVAEERETIADLTGTHLVPPVQKETNAHNHHGILPTAAPTLRSGTLPKLDEAERGLDTAPSKTEDVFPSSTTGSSTNTNSIIATIISNAGNTGNNAMARTSTSTINATATINTSGSPYNAIELKKHLRAVAHRLDAANALNVGKVVEDAERGEKTQAFCTAVGLEGPLLEFIQDYDGTMEHPLADFAAAENAQIKHLHKIVKELKVEDVELCGGACLLAAFGTHQCSTLCTTKK